MKRLRRVLIPVAVVAVAAGAASVAVVLTHGGADATVKRVDQAVAIFAARTLSPTASPS